MSVSYHTSRSQLGGRCMPASEFNILLTQLNAFLAGMLAWQGFVVFAVAIYFTSARVPEAEKRGGVSQPHHTAFLLFWSFAWTAVLFDWVESLYREQLRDQAWLAWSVDTFENFLFGGAAYALFRR